MTIRLNMNEVRDAILDYLANNHEDFVFEEEPEIRFEVNGAPVNDPVEGSPGLAAIVVQEDEDFTNGPYR